MIRLFASAAVVLLWATVAQAQCDNPSANAGLGGKPKPDAQAKSVDLSCFQGALRDAMRSSFLSLSGGTLTGPLLSTSSGRFGPPPNNVPTLDFLGGTINFQRRITSGNPSYAGTRVVLDNYSNDYTPEGWGGYPNVPSFEATATSHAGSNGTVSAVVASLVSQGNNPYVSQDQALVGAVKKTGQNSTWGLAIQNEDNSGLPPQAFASVGAEVDVLSNGPDSYTSLYDPGNSNRWLLLLAGKVNPVSPYESDRFFRAGTLVKEVPAKGAPMVYIAETAGKTGVHPPEWPAHGTVTDGDVTWLAGEEFRTTIGVGVLVGAGNTDDAQFNTLYAGDGTVNNAGLDLSTVKLGQSYGAGIRLAKDMPIDFSGDGTASGQNRHVLEYSNNTQALNYTIGGFTALSISDTGLASFLGQIRTPLNTPKSSSSPCLTGTRTADENYEYVCVSTNTWKRAALSAF